MDEDIKLKINSNSSNNSTLDESKLKFLLY